MKDVEQRRPKVSVVMPAYNAASFIGDAVESVLAQTYADWELIVVDDGSTDATHDTMHRYTDPRIVYLGQDNKGAAAARNAALEVASGEYVAFLDADDLYLPNALGDLVAYLDSHQDADIVYSDGFFCDEEDRPLMRLSEHRPGLYEGDVLEILVLTSSVICAINCTLTRRAAIVDHTIRFDPGLVIGEDWDFWIQLPRSARFGYLDKLTCMYRVHGANTTRVSGVVERRSDLVHGRLKVINSCWLGDMSLSTRQELFYGLLIGLLSGDSAHQREILVSDPFLALPSAVQATLLRHVASDCVLNGNAPQLAQDCLRAAVNLLPADHKSWLLLKCLDVDISLCRVLVFGWQLARNAAKWVRRIGKRMPKPAPGALTPLTHNRRRRTALDTSVGVSRKV